jgi:lipopolysaccharide export system protein LptC
MLHSRNLTAMLATALVLASGLLLIAAADEQAPAVVNPDDPNFDFSVFFTGNVRGNLEPCG